MRWSKNITQESIWAEDSAGEPGGEANVEEEFGNMLGKLTYPLVECSFLCLCSKLKSDVLSFFPCEQEGDISNSRTILFDLSA